MQPAPGNQWPHDMRLTIEDDSHALLELLWIREAWGLQPDMDDPPPPLADDHGDGQPVTGASPTRLAEWQNAWPAIWDDCVRHAGRIQDGVLFEAVRDAAVGSPKREELLRELVGPSWRDVFGSEALPEEYESWALARFEAHSANHPRSMNEQPEWVALPALVPAWRAGLEKVVAIPCRGSFTRVVGPHSLMVTQETRNDPALYSDALAQFT